MKAVFEASILILIWLLNICLITTLIDKYEHIKQAREFNKQMIKQIKEMTKGRENDDTKRDDK